MDEIYNINITLILAFILGFLLKLIKEAYKEHPRIIEKSQGMKKKDDLKKKEKKIISSIPREIVLS